MQDIMNANFKLNGLDEPFITHFGIGSDFSHVNDRMAPRIVCGFNEDGTSREHSGVTEETMLWRAPDVTAWVSGSWQCWGVTDQLSDGEEHSLHVEAYTRERPSHLLLWDMYQSLRMDVQDGEGYVLNHAYITQRDHSDILYVVTFDARQAHIYFVTEDVLP